MSKRFPWLKLSKKTDPEVPYEPPIPLGNISNGEFFFEQSPRDRKLEQLILQKCDDHARKLGMDRREFIATTMGMATTLSMVNLVSGCGDDGAKSGGGAMASDGSMLDGGGADGGYMIPDAAMLDCEEADELLGGNEFIMDCQTHHIEDEEQWRERHPGQFYGGDIFYSSQWENLNNDCELQGADCIGPDRYADAIFMQSDTTVAVLSGFPDRICNDASLCNALISNQDMVLTRDWINDAAGSQRVVQHCQVAPNDNWSLQAQMMENIASEYGNHGWKCYPPALGGWWLDDPRVGEPFIQKAVDLGNPLICVHKGFPLGGFSRTHTDPQDVGPAAMNWPDVNFIIYHSAIYHGAANVNMLNNGEGPYDPNGDIDPENPTRYPVDESVNSLIKVIEENDLKGKNVYAELGSAWVLTMHFSNAAQHLIGKLLKHLGEDNVVWGTECLWFGSPQPQIETFRTLEISKEFQDTYGYPALTQEIKEKILGKNAARIYGIDPEATRCKLREDKLAMLKTDLDGEFGARRWALAPKMLGPRTRREFINSWRWKNFNRKV